jgi:hypothetical protein
MELDIGYISVPFRVFEQMKKEFFEAEFKDILSCTNTKCSFRGTCDEVKDRFDKKIGRLYLGDIQFSVELKNNI